MMRDQITGRTKDGVLAGAGILAAVGASSCCVLPLVLALVGVSGAWIGGLVALAPYQPGFMGAGVLFVGLGLWRAHGRWPECQGSQCEARRFRNWTRAGLWLAAVLLLIAGTTTWWSPLFA